MNRAARRAQRKFLEQENRKFPVLLVPIPRDQWPTARLRPQLGVWRSRFFLVQAFVEPNDIVRLSVCRTQVDDEGRWKDGIEWDDLQFAKHQVGYGDRDAVEIYPADEDLVNVANMRHLWVLPKKLPFG